MGGQRSVGFIPLTIGRLPPRVVALVCILLFLTYSAFAQAAPAASDDSPWEILSAELFFMPLAAGGVGWIAQSWKCRSGLAWGFCSFVVMICSFMFVPFIAFLGSTFAVFVSALLGWGFSVLGVIAIFGASVALVAGGLFILVLAVLPKRQRLPEPATAATGP